MDPSRSLERRIVSVLFADLVGFTPLSEGLDPEDVATIQDAYFATVRDVMQRHGGQLEKFIGDAAMAVFGVPVARDGDVERAVRAGFALIHAIEQIGASLELPDDALRLRVGINTGEAVTAETGADEGRVTGDTVNTAARLQTAAPPGGVLVGEQTALAVADVAELEQVAPLELKGKAQPFAARLVRGFRPEASRDAAMGALRAPTLGREQEVELLSQALERAAAGAVERWLVVAPPGVGKTRLLREIAARVPGQASAPVLWRTRTRPDAVSPFEAIAILVRDALAGSAESDAQTRLSDALLKAGAGAMRAEVVQSACLSVAWPGAAPTGDARPADDRDALFTAWLEGLDALADGRPQVWLIEDVHWAGGDVLTFLDRATDADAKAHGRLILSTTRPSLLETNVDWAADQPDAGRHVLQLPTLASTDARALITALVGDALPDELVQRIAERSDGNCLFIEELLRTWVSVGSLTRADSGAWRMTVAADEIALPQSVQAIYAAQLDDLPADARRLARRASVAGRRFPLGALEPLGAAGAEGLRPLQARELVVGPQQEPLFGTAYSYRHALLRDAGYASLARAERARLHIRLARWLDEAAGDHANEIAEQIASHYAAALDSAPQLAVEVGDGLGRHEVRRLAADWYERAGQGTLALAAHDAARQLLKRSIELTDDAAKLDRARRWERLGDATAFAANMDEGAAAYLESVDLYRQAVRDEPADRIGAARAGLARTVAALADVWYQQLKFDAAEKLAAEVLASHPELDEASRARLAVAQTLVALGARGQEEGNEQRLLDAIEVADRSGDAELQLSARSALTVLRAESGTGVADDFHALEQAAILAGDWSRAISAAINVAFTLLDDRAEEAFGAIADARNRAIAHGRTEDGGWTHYVEAEAAFITGDWDRARSAGLLTLDLAEANAYRRLAVRTIHVLVPIGAVRGERALLERAAHFYESLEGKFEFPDSPYSRIIRTAQDVEFAAAGLAPPFVPDPAPRIVAFNDEPNGGSWSAALDRVFRAWVDAGLLDDAATAVATMEAALPKFKSLSAHGRGTFELLRGRLASARGDSAEAARAGHAALSQYRISAAPWWMAKALRLIERAGAADQQMLDEVAAIERGLGAARPTA